MSDNRAEVPVQEPKLAENMVATVNAADAAPVSESDSEVATEPSSTVHDDSALAWLDRIRGLERAFQDRLSLLENLYNRYQEAQAAQAEDRRLREQLFEKLEASRSSFVFQLIRPMINRIATLYDLKLSWDRNPPSKVEEFAQCLKILGQQIDETLQLFGIEVINPNQGDPFDRRWHYVMDTVPCAEPQMHERIENTLQYGFVYFGQNERTGALAPTLVRPARVRTWKYSAQNAQPVPAEVQPMAGVTQQDSGSRSESMVDPG